MFKTILALAMFGAASAGAAVSAELGEWAMRQHFAAFEVKFSKTYATAADREGKFWMFVQNLEDAVAKNAKLLVLGDDAIHGITKFSDISPEEFRATMLNGQMSAAVDANVTVATPTKKATASAFDWRDSNMVTAVKNQGQCGSCWAHSAVETVESQYAIAGNTLTSFSVQQVTSCDTVDQGCGGGWYYTAWTEYMEGAGGLTTESAYPYDRSTARGSVSDCQSGLSMVAGTTPKSYSWATEPCGSFRCNSQDEETLKDNLVSYGPISIAVDASQFNSYTGGVVTSASCSSSAFKLDHAIQIVGYNAEASVPYWIVRNSWDTAWGIDGYIHLKMGENTCGIADKAAMVQMA